MPPDMRYFPDGLYFNTDTSPSCLFSSIGSASGGREEVRFDSISQNLTKPAFDPVAKKFPFGFKKNKH